MTEPAKHQHNKIHWEKWTAVATVVMAVCALVTSLWQGYSMQQHNKLSLRPYLELEANQNHIGTDNFVLEVYVNNNGLGPAEVTSLQMRLRDQELSNTEQIWSAMGLDINKGCFSYGTVQRFYKVGDKQVVIRAAGACALTKAQLDVLLNNLSITLEYRSLYGETFTAAWKF